MSDQLGNRQRRVIVLIDALVRQALGEYLTNRLRFGAFSCETVRRHSN